MPSASTLNGISLLAITLVTGILVDDAIVEIENVVRHMRLGKSPYRASIEGADEIGLAVIAITATLIAVFAPVSFMGGIAGRYFMQFGLTIAVRCSCRCCWRLITPLLAAYFLRDHAMPRRRSPGDARLYPPRRLVGASQMDHAGGRAGSVRRLDHVHQAPALGLHPEAGQCPHPVHDRAGAGARLPDTIAVSDRVSPHPALPEVTSVFVDGGRQAGGKKKPASLR